MTIRGTLQSSWLVGSVPNYAVEIGSIILAGRTDGFQDRPFQVQTR